MDESLQVAQSLDVLCVGYACVDLNFRVSHHPSADEKLRASAMFSCGGGPAANAAVAIARLGGQAAFAGYLGNDAFGDSHLREFSIEGYLSITWIAETLRLKLRRSVSSQMVTARSSIFVIQRPLPLRALFRLKNYVRKPSFSMATNHYFQRIFWMRRANSNPDSPRRGSLHEGTLKLYNKVDYLIVSEKFAKQFTNEDDPRLALAAMDGAATFVAATWGSDGVYWQNENGQHHTPAFDIDPIDTTGAGDAFHGAFALGLVRGLSPRENMRFSSATGALTCLKFGARSALPERQEVGRLSQVRIAKD